MDLDKRILSLKEEGRSLREISKEIPISHVAVKKRLDRLTVNPNNKPDQGSDTISIDFDNRDLDWLWPDVGGAISSLDKVLKELKLKDTDKKVIIDAGMGWEFIKTPW